MHISKLQLVNYRNFARANMRFNKGINTVIGENGSGKTNIFRAIRLLLDENMPRSATKLEDKDFHRGIGDWRGHWIVISVEFDEVSQDETVQSLFLHGTGAIEGGAIDRATYNLIYRPRAPIRQRLAQLALGDKEGLKSVIESISLSDYEAVFTGRSTIDLTKQENYIAIVGDFDNVKFPEKLDPPEIGGRIPPIFSMTKEVCFTFVQALRDVVDEFRNNRTNPLFVLLRSKSGEIDPAEMKPITDRVLELNSAIEGLADVRGIRHDIRSTITDAAGHTYSPSALSIRSDLPSEADKLFQSLKLFVGESEPGHESGIQDLSLGGANLIYLTLKLLEFKYQKAKQSVANFLIIEEPEAHIHTHIQKTLFDKLNYPDTQVIYSTHSTHISEVSNVENINILGRNGARCEVFQPTVGLSTTEVGNIQRYLDAVRSNLLFAKSVILVEGDAEEILIPILVKKVLGVSLDELGISLINIRSTGFENVAVLFHDMRIRKRCAIVTDLDEAFIETSESADDSKAVATSKIRAVRSQAVGLARKTKLTDLTKDNAWAGVYFAPHTFEVDLLSGNSEKFVAVLGDVYVDGPTIELAKAELESAELSISGSRALTMAENMGKGWFAILLGRVVDYRAVIPEYILKAIFFAHGPLGRPLAADILAYRLMHIAGEEGVVEETLKYLDLKLTDFRDAKIEFGDIRAAMLESFPADRINSIIAGL